MKKVNEDINFDFYLQRHDIPISAIPCFAYRRALEEEEKQKEIDRRIEEQIRNGTWPSNYESGQNTICTGTQSKSVSSNSTDKPETANGTTCPFQKFGPSTRQEASKSEAQETIEAKRKKILESVKGQEMENGIHEIQESETLPMSKGKCMRNLISSDPESSPSANLQTDETKTQQTLDLGDQEMPESSEKKISDVSNKKLSKSSCPRLDLSEDLLSETLRIKEEILQDMSGQNCQVNNDTPSKEEDASEKEKENNSNSTATEPIPLNRQPVILPGGIVMPPPRVETINTSWKTQHLTAEQINDYCKKLFKFKTVNIMHFK